MDHTLFIDVAEGQHLQIDKTTGICQFWEEGIWKPLRWWYNCEIKDNIRNEKGHMVRYIGASPNKTKHTFDIIDALAVNPQALSFDVRFFKPLTRHQEIVIMLEEQWRKIQI